MHRRFLFLIFFCSMTPQCLVPTRADESINVAATILVAAHDAAPESRAAAHFVADGQGDQEEINAAIRSLPASGGVVQLTEGTFDIRRIPGKLGGILIRAQSCRSCRAWHGDKADSGTGTGNQCDSNHWARCWPCDDS